MSPHYSVLPVLALFVAMTVGCGARTPIDTEPDASGGVTYGAVYFATGMERFAVFKLDEAMDRCTVVGFVAPVDWPTPGVELPERWAVEMAWRGDAAACDDFEYHMPDGATHATSISGSGTWGETLCEIDVDLALEFEGGPEEMVVAEDVPLGWSGCEE